MHGYVLLDMNCRLMGAVDCVNGEVSYFPLLTAVFGLSTFSIIRGNDIHATLTRVMSDYTVFGVPLIPVDWLISYHPVTAKLTR